MTSNLPSENPQFGVTFPVITLKIDIDPQTEESLEKAASKKGIAAGQMAAEVISDRFASPESDPSNETQLLDAINQGWPEQRWLRYRELIKQRDQRAISESDLSILIDQRASEVNKRPKYRRDFFRILGGIGRSLAG